MVEQKGEDDGTEGEEEERVQGRSTWIYCIKVYLEERKRNNQGQHNAIDRFPAV